MAEQGLVWDLLVYDNIAGQHNETATCDQASDAVTALGSART